MLELNGAVDFNDDYALGGRNVFDRAAALLAPRSHEHFSSASDTVPACESLSSTTSPQFATP